jgi:hypothetical protein
LWLAVDPLGRILGGVAALRDHGGDRLADERPRVAGRAEEPLRGGRPVRDIGRAKEDELASRQRPSASSPITAAMPTSAKSPWRRATSTNAVPVRAVGMGGISSSTSSSSGSCAVVKTPR